MSDTKSISLMIYHLAKYDKALCFNQGWSQTINVLPEFVFIALCIHVICLSENPIFAHQEF